MVHIRGIIVPVKWDEKGNVADIGIETYDEDFYLIDNRSKGFDLIGLIQESVELGGDLTQALENKIFRVCEIRKLKATG